MIFRRNVFGSETEDSPASLSLLSSSFSALQNLVVFAPFSNIPNEDVDYSVCNKIRRNNSRLEPVPRFVETLETPRETQEPASASFPCADGRRDRRITQRRDKEGCVAVKRAAGAVSFFCVGVDLVGMRSRRAARHPQRARRGTRCLSGGRRFRGTQTREVQLAGVRQVHERCSRAWGRCVACTKLPN